MKVIVKEREKREQMEIFSIEDFVPADHLLRKIDSAVDFTHIYDIVEDLYCADNGRPSIDPVVIYWILSEINKAGYLSPEAVFIDGTHIKANANLNKSVKRAVPQAAKVYEEQLMEEINEDRDKHDKKPFDGLYDRLTNKNPEIETIVTNAGYKTPWISKRILDDGRIPVLPYKRPMGKKDFYPPYEYI